MKISKYIHSCLLVEEGDTKILFDPGTFSFREGFVSPNDFTDLSAICITHRHVDHVDGDALAVIMKNNADVPIYSNRGVAEMLAPEGIEVRVFESGTKKIGSMTVEALSAEHEPLLTLVPHNTAYIINNTFLHPGDSLHLSLHDRAGISVLALPVTAPWADKIRIAGFGEAMRPRHIIPIHDGFVKDFFREGLYDEFVDYFKSRGSEFHSLGEPGASITI